MPWVFHLDCLGHFERQESMNKTILSIFHSLSVMDVEQIERAKVAIDQEPSFNEIQRVGFLSLCDMAIEERRRWQRGERKI